MTRSTLVAWCAIAFLRSPAPACAQFTDAHSYDTAPAGTNQVELAYGFAQGNAAVDPSLVIAGATVNLNQATIDYTHYFGLFHRLAWVEAALPVAHLGGSISGVNVDAATAGAGDSSYEFAMLVRDGPSRSIGVSVTVTAPTGQYNADRILNPGSDRWSFKPELALSHRFGAERKWQLDTYANIAFYTDNTAYRGREILRQEPLAGLEGHISYAINEGLWVSADTRYAFRGTTFVDGADQDNAQQNVLVGSEMNVSLNARHSLQFAVATVVVHHNSPAVTGLSVKYDYAW
jgi:hypothetical protein